MDTKRCHTLIREWWKEQMGDLDMVDPKEMADYAIEAMLQDATFLARFSEEFLRPVVLDVAREVFASGRRAYKEQEPKPFVYLRLGIMVKEQCLAAAESRERRATGDLTRAGMLRMVAGRLAPGQRVSEVWSEEELERLEQQITVERPVYGINGKTILDIMREVA
jgi:hypothetical protein